MQTWEENKPTKAGRKNNKSELKRISRGKTPGGNGINYSARQIQIMEAAMLIIDKYGIQGMTTKAIAKAIQLSEAAMYRHFEGKTDVLIGIINHFVLEMYNRIGLIAQEKNISHSEIIYKMLHSQLTTFEQKPHVVSVIFSEGIFENDKVLYNSLLSIMSIMKMNIQSHIQMGQSEGEFNPEISAETITTLIIGSIRMLVMKWKILNGDFTLVEEGKKVAEAIFMLIKTK